MFVSRHKYNGVVGQLTDLALKHRRLLREWNTLVGRINELGGEGFLESAGRKTCSTQFTPGELDTLVKLCHPDKHGGLSEAEEITKKLLSARRLSRADDTKPAVNRGRKG